MRCFQLLRLSGFMVALAPLIGVLPAQFGIATVANEDIGRPPEPPFITFAQILKPGKMATDRSLPLSGPVAEVLYEEVRAQETPAGRAGEVITSIRTKYDEAGRATEEILSDLLDFGTP